MVFILGFCMLSWPRGVLPWALRFDRTAAGIEATGDIGRLPSKLQSQIYPVRGQG